MTPLATPLPPAAFALLVWGAAALVLLVFLYEAAVVVREAHREATE